MTPALHLKIYQLFVRGVPLQAIAGRCNTDIDLVRAVIRERLHAPHPLS